MTILVEPGNALSTHHISLTDGYHIVGLHACDQQGNANPLAITRAPVPRTAMKTSQGDQKYSDFEPPWSPLSQNSWLGGRGSDDAETDSTRFLDAYCANTAYGSIINGPQVQWSAGYRSAENYAPGNVLFRGLLDTTLYYARMFTAAANATMGSIGMLIRRRGTPTANLVVALYGNTAGAPGTLLKSVTLAPADFTDTISEWRYFTFSSGQAITLGAYYWIVVYSTAGTSSDHWQVGMYDSGAPSYDYLTSANGSSWSQAEVCPYFRLVDIPATASWNFFQYRLGMYAYRNQDGAAPKLYLNGARGNAISNAGVLSTLKAGGTPNWLTDQWVGCVVLIIGGLGSAEQQGWRTITGNTADTLTVSTPWLITQDTTTEFVIIGSNTWTEITGHGLTASITDVCVVGSIAYFCQGDSVNIRRMYLNAGAHTWADDGTNKATFLCLEANTDVWKGNNSSGAAVAKATKVTSWGTDLTFGTATNLSDDYGRITNLVEYNDTLYIMREGMVFYNSSGTIKSIKLEEMRTVQAYTNGRAAITHNVYLYFNIGGGIERYYSSALDDVGPDRDKGLPDDRKGVISVMVGYPGSYLAAMDAGSTGYSSVLYHNGTGWHELYRAPYGQRITGMYFECVPGSSLDRLWIAQGPDLIWLPFPSNTLDPRNDANYKYTHEACVTSGYFYAGLYDTIKYIHSIKLFTEDLEAGVCTAEVEYQLDDDTEWQPLSEVYEVSPITEVKIDPQAILGGCTGRRIRYRVHLLTTNASKTPEVKGVVLETVTRVPIKYSYALPYRIKDEEGASAFTKRDLLESWAANLTPLTMRCVFQAYDKKTVFIDPSPSRPYQQTSEGYIETLTILEV